MQTGSRISVGGLYPSKSALLSISLVVAFCALTAVSSKLLIPLPFSPVPITLQSFVVLLAGMMLGSKRGASSQIALIGLGLAGLPVFSAPLPGILVLMGPTGGYILGFVLAAFVAGKIYENSGRLSWLKEFSLVFLASLFIFLPGVIWLAQFTGYSFSKALTIGFFPFLVGDVVKCFAAVAVRRSWASLRN